MGALVNLVGDTTFGDLPDEAVHETKRVLLDSIGVALGAPRMTHGRICRDLGKQLGGAPESTILGTKGKVSCLNAAFTNGELINTLYMDPLFAFRSPAVVIPATLALAEKACASGKGLILAVALGHEIAARIGSAVRPTYWPEPGLGADKGKIIYEKVCGNAHAVFGAAVGAGKILDLSPAKMAHAMGIAGYAGPPNVFSKWIDTTPGNMLQIGPAGFGAEVGVKSALLAEAGYTGDTDIFEGNYSFWNFSGAQGWNTSKVVEDIGTKWRCHQIFYKRYPVGA
jgi:2-methylcitrate dehydratase PrpD